MNQQLISGRYSIGKTIEIIDSLAIEKLIVVTGRRSYSSSGAAGALCQEFKRFDVKYFSDFELNPKLEDAKRGANLARHHGAQLIVAIGGGSVLDMAKLIKAFSSEPDHAELILDKKIQPSSEALPIIAIPTTAGSGSESTHFAVVYRQQQKYSVAHKSLLPEYVVLDGSLTISASHTQKAFNVLDAMAQSIESAWSVAGTDESRQLAFRALEKIMKVYGGYIQDEPDIDAAQSMLEGANLAGRAIDISKTTAAHAWSYALTTRHNIAHGHAVWFTLPRIFAIHEAVARESKIDGEPLRNLAATMQRLRKILEMPDDENAVDYFSTMLRAIDINVDWSAVGDLDTNERVFLSRHVNRDRMENNPISFNQCQINEIFDL